MSRLQSTVRDEASCRRRAWPPAPLPPARGATGTPGRDDHPYRQPLTS